MHLDELCLVSSIKPRSINTLHNESNRGFNNSYFYRTHLLWNRLPLEMRTINASKIFRKKLIHFIWNSEIASLYINTKSCVFEPDV